MTEKIKLRDYQNNLINNAREALANNFKRILIVAPTGSGKTVIASQLAKLILAKNGTVYFVVHRIELLRQAENTFLKYGISGVKCFMVQTLANKLTENIEPTVIVFDEAHHASSNTYQKIIDYYKNSHILGLTATPCRFSGKSLGDVFEIIIQDITASQLIEQQFLANYDYYCPKIDTNYSGLKIQAGDIKPSDCFNIMDKPKIYGNIINNYKKYCFGRKTIIYATTIEHSLRVVEQFNLAGFNAVHLDSNTSRIDREQIDIDFRAGKYNIISNVGLLGEGYDIPDCDCVILLRRTLSLSLFIQMSTRCLRPNEDKHAIILDCTGSVFIHGLPTIDRVWSLADKIKTKNIDAEPDILARTCQNCFKTYAGIAIICPFCGNNNGKTRQQIKQIEDAELQKIEQIQKTNNKNDLKDASKSLQGLIDFGINKNYAAGWAFKRWQILQKYKVKK